MIAKVSSPNMMSQIPIILSHSKRDHFWFFLTNLSEIVGFSCLEHHSSHKTNVKDSVSCEGITDFFYNGFRQKKNCPFSLHLTFNRHITVCIA